MLYLTGAAAAVVATTARARISDIFFMQISKGCPRAAVNECYRIQPPARFALKPRCVSS
jgi:hypothetical protein